jgi:ceramide glucosyltransferase
MEFGWFLVALSLGGAGYALLAGLTASRFMRTPSCGHRSDAPVTILKPLYLGEPGLQENLESFFAQDFSAPVQIVFGVHDQADPAIEVVQALQAKYPGFDTCIVAEPAMYGPNAKVSNLINMIPAAKHGILILSDSDIRVPHNWLTEVTGALARPGVGLVTCLYKGEAGGRGLWPTLAAMGTSYDFLPNVVTGVSLGLAEPCMGSTIALTRDVLEKIGGFDAFASYLADDYEMGRAVRKLGLELAIPALGPPHQPGRPYRQHHYLYGSACPDGRGFAGFPPRQSGDPGHSPWRAAVSEVPDRPDFRHQCWTRLDFAPAGCFEFRGIRGVALG